MVTLLKLLYKLYRRTHNHWTFGKDWSRTPSTRGHKHKVSHWRHWSLKCSGAITQVCLKEIRNIPLTFSLLDLELFKPLVSLEDSVLSTKHARANTKAIRLTVKSWRNPKMFSRLRPQLLAMLTETGANNWLILTQWHIVCYSLRDKEETRQNPVSPDGFYVGLRSVLTNDIPARQFVASHHSTAT